MFKLSRPPFLRHTKHKVNVPKKAKKYDTKAATGKKHLIGKMAVQWLESQTILALSIRNKQTK